MESQRRILDCVLGMQVSEAKEARDQIAMAEAQIAEAEAGGKRETVEMEVSIIRRQNVTKSEIEEAREKAATEAVRAEKLMEDLVRLQEELKTRTANGPFMPVTFAGLAALDAETHTKIAWLESELENAKAQVNPPARKATKLWRSQMVSGKNNCFT